MYSKILKQVDERREQTIELLQAMVRIPSPSFQEGQLAAFVEETFNKMGLSTFTNALGDVTGVVRSPLEDRTLLLNTHLDQAEPGDMDEPYSGKIMDGETFGVSGVVVYGRGTNGQKASLAAMIQAAAVVLDLQIPLRRRFAINVGVMEECGGHLSPRHLIEVDRFPVGAVLCGEHTNLRPVNRQRGMLHLHVRIQGKGAHAAAPEGSSSALTGMARVALALENLKERLPADDKYGKALVSLNKMRVSPNVINAIPDLCEGVVDIRQPASMSRDEIVDLVKMAIDEALIQQPGLQHAAEIRKRRVRSYTGLEEYSDGGMLPFFTSEDDPLVVALTESIQRVTLKRAEPELWSISSEAGYFSTVAGIPVVCFGPGEDRFTHNRLEHVRVEDLMTAAKVYASMIYKLCC